jgi:hypothetical protein
MQRFPQQHGRIFRLFSLILEPLNTFKSFLMIHPKQQLSEESYQSQRLRGAMLMVYFRWIFISLIGVLLSVQLLAGHKGESQHALILMLVYGITNLLLWYSVKKAYDPHWVGYLSAILDVGIVSTHLFLLTSKFDPVAATAAATTFLYPILFILYSFRIDQRLLLFLVLISTAAFNTVYLIHYQEYQHIYLSLLSLSPESHLFKSTYILFLGFLCLYFQSTIRGVIQKEVEITKKQADVENKVQIEQEKSLYAELMMRQTARQNKLLEEQIRAKELIAEDLAQNRAALEAVNRTLEETIAQRTEELTKVNTRVLKLEKENLQSQFDMLKQQVNPHFLFNSLNVLTSLIRIDPGLAEAFTERLAKVYRYVLENKDKDLITLTTEMDFLHAYLFLINIRFEDKVHVEVKDLGAADDYYVVPLALQLLIENAIKHNTFSRKSPLKITIQTDNDQYLTVTNNLQSRETHHPSTGVGLDNITKRYALLTDKPALFCKTETEFVARIPLLEPENKRSI